MSECQTELKPIYTTLNSVKVRLANKVQFQKEAELKDGELPNELLAQLICDAETDVEMALRGRYAIPFRSCKQGSWAALPDHTKRAIRQVVDMRAVMNVLDTEFGRGTHIDPDNYKDPLFAHYTKLLKLLLGQDDEAKARENRFRFTPPLEDLLLSPQNREADDGFKGMVINTDGSREDASTYAENQINDPSENYYLSGILRSRGT